MKITIYEFYPFGFYKECACLLSTFWCGMYGVDDDNEMTVLFVWVGV